MADTVAVFAPDGTIRSIPSDQAPAAFAAGGKPAVKMTDPQGTQRYVPQDQVSLAKQSGGKLVDQGWWDAATDEVSKIVSSHVKSWLSGGGNVGQASSFQQGFDPFHPVESAGYLVPQPIKDVVNALRTGQDVKGATARATVQAVSQAPAMLQAGLRPDYVNPEGAATATDIPPSARPMTAGTEGGLMGARGPVAATPGQVGAIKTAINDVAKATPNPTIWQALRHPVVSAGQIALRKYGQSLPDDGAATEAPPAGLTLPPTASWTGRVSGVPPVEGTPTAGVQAQPAAIPEAQAAVSPANLGKFKAQAVKSLGAENWDAVPEHVKSQVLTQAFAKGGEFEGATPPAEVAQAAKAQVAKAVDEVVPPTGKTAASNLQAKAEAQFYVDRGNTEAAVAAVQRYAGPEFKPWRAPLAPSEPAGQSERLADAQDDAAMRQSMQADLDKQGAMGRRAAGRENAASNSADLTKVAGTEGVQGQNISDRYQTLPAPEADMEANKMLGYDPHGIGKPVKLTKTPKVKAYVQAAQDFVQAVKGPQ